MHALRSSWKIVAGAAAAAFLVSTLPAPARAYPRPGVKQTFRLMAKAVSYINVNRVFCGVYNIGDVCVDSSGTGTTQGGYWPRGTPDNYVFNSGLQVEGIIQGTKPDNPWAGDTTGGWFFDGAGGRQQTEGVTPVYQAFNSTDLANWPADAYVPDGDSVALLYAPALRGLKSASQGDVHFLTWEGNPSYSSSRSHPLGILVDYRLLAWNYPAGAQDVVFLVATVYNITSANQSDYAVHRAGIRDELLAAGQKFQALNDAKFNIQLPVGGYTIGPMYMAFAADNDVGNANDDYNGVILPFAMGYTYEGEFDRGTAGWTFDPGIFGAPFFAGVGFVGMKYLKGPDGPGQIQLITTFCNGGACGAGHSDPGSSIINFRLLAGTPAPTDGQCNVAGIAAQTHICFMLFGSNGADTRMAESSTPLTLGPGEAKTLVMAYVFAPPVLIPGFTPNSGTNLDPGNPTWSEYIDSIQKYNGLNRIDSITGFVKYSGPTTDADGSKHVPTENDFIVVKGSLLGKANVAQAVFNVGFLQEFSPDAPEFFLIPGDKQVTVLWKPSDTETLGDPFYSVVKSPTEVDATGATVPNPLYDPNYRQFDVEGYRVYRGRSDTPSALVLLAQFDYAGTTFKDYTGTVLNGNCAPEIGVTTDCPVNFPNASNPLPPGTAATTYQAYNIGPQPGAVGALEAGAPLVFVDQTAGNRIALAGGTTTLTTVADTAGSAGGFPPLADTGVPFIFVDKAGTPNCGACGVNNGVVYYYSVTAFDVNSPGHGPTSLESAKVTKQVIPGAQGSNYITTASALTSATVGRDGPLTDATMPTIDSVTGEFSKAFPPSTALTVSLAGYPTALLNGSGSTGVQYDSTVVVSGVAATSVSVVEWFTAGAGTTVSIPVTISGSTGSVTGNGSFPAFSIDSAASVPYGGGAGYSVGGTFSFTAIPTSDEATFGRGCANGWYQGGVPTGKAAGQCYYFGPRWYSGTNENTPDPNTAGPAIQGTGQTTAPAGFGNAGALPGVVAVHHPDAYDYITGSQWRDVELLMAPFVTAADYNLYWGAGGKIDSVIDVTDHLVVPFSTRIGGSWGVLNASNAPVAGSYDGVAALTATDFACVAPLPALLGPMGSGPLCTASFALTQTAVPGQLGYFVGGVSKAKTPTLAANNGFGLYLKGRVFMFELTGGAVPAAGTVWSERDYVGGIYGGNGKDKNSKDQYGTYAFSRSLPLPFTAPGLAVKSSYTVSNELVAANQASVAKVHTVPDPYYVTSAFDRAVDAKQIEFVNVPVGATIRIYSSSGVLLRVLQNNAVNFSGIVIWNVRNRTNQFVSSGVYFYNVEAGGVNHTGRMTIVNYASTVQ